MSFKQSKRKTYVCVWGPWKTDLTKCAGIHVEHNVINKPWTLAVFYRKTVEDELRQEGRLALGAALSNFAKTTGVFADEDVGKCQLDEKY